MSNQRPKRRTRNQLTKLKKSSVLPRPKRAGGNPTGEPPGGLDNDGHDGHDRDGIVPVAGLSIFDPVFMGTDETGYRAEVVLPYRNLLMGGEPGSGKSVALNNVV